MLDLLVVGGGVNGCGIARDAAGRGLKVLLVERGDLAGATSSASSKLIHGGLRYLEQYEFRLVREALAEREVLLRIAPHIVWPLRFVLPYRPHMRPRWMLRAGLFLYDHLARRVSLPAASGWRTAGGPLKPEITTAFAYSDCWVQDSRLVVLNAKDAARRGAEIRTRCAFLGATRQADGWTARLGDGSTVRARQLVNAAGPWVMQALGLTGVAPPGRIRLVRGSHIVLPRLYEGEHAFILQNDDGRVVFVIPYEGRFSLVGTTDVVQDSPDTPHCTDEEAAYLCAAVAQQFRVAPDPAQIIWRYAGVRPLFDDGADNPSAITRDYVLKLDDAAAPLLSVFGGKITTYRRLAEEALERLSAPGQPWTATAPLPGGDIASPAALEATLAARYPWLEAAQRQRYARAYGSETLALLGDATRPEDLGARYGAGLTARELDWLRREEWAQTAEDVLWRRSKLGLHMSAAERDAVAAALG